MSKKNIVFLLCLFYLSLSAWYVHAAETGKPEKSIPSFIEKLSDERPHVRQNAAINLGEQFRSQPADEKNIREKDKAVKALIAAVHDKNREVRRSAVKALGIINDESSIPVLRELLNTEKDPRVQMVLVKTLGSFKDTESEKGITGFVQHNDLPIRVAALRALGKIGTRSAYAVIIDHVDDPIEAIRVVAADLCAQHGLHKAVPALKKNCGHEIPEVRDSAVRAIGVLSDADHIKFLQKLKRKEENKDIQNTIKNAIAEIEKRFPKE